MQYFQHELFASHAFVETRREHAYRRTLRYGHARHGRVCETVAPVAATVVALPRVQAVVDAMLAANASSAASSTAAAAVDGAIAKAA